MARGSASPVHNLAGNHTRGHTEKEGVNWWARQDSNLGAADYESELSLGHLHHINSSRHLPKHYCERKRLIVSVAARGRRTHLGPAGLYEQTGPVALPFPGKKPPRSQ